MKGTVSKNIRIKINEKETSVPSDTTLFHLKNQFKSNADVIIYNGFPFNSDRPLKEGDEVVFIKKGEAPSSEEFESLMMARHTPGIHQKIKKSIVGIAGLGGLGSAIAIALARIGVGRLILVDFDMVEPSNLNRQQYFVHQIGMPKVEALQKNIATINPYVKIQTYQEKLDRNNVERIFKEAEVVVEAFDRAEEKAMLINAVSEKMPDKYIVAASGVAGYGDNNEIKTVRFSSKIFHRGGSKDSRPTRDGIDGTKGGNRCPPSSQHRLENPFGEEERKQGGLE